MVYRTWGRALGLAWEFEHPSTYSLYDYSGYFADCSTVNGGSRGGERVESRRGEREEESEERKVEKEREERRRRRERSRGGGAKRP